SPRFSHYHCLKLRLANSSKAPMRWSRLLCVQEEKVPILPRSKFPFYREEAKAKFVQLDYQSGGNIAMARVLPDEAVSLKSYIRNSLKPDTLCHWYSVPTIGKT